MSEIYPTHVAVALLPHDMTPGHIWLAQRTASREWQLPGKKVADNEKPEEALRSGLETKLGISPRTLIHLGRLPLLNQGEVVLEADCFFASGFAFEPLLLDGETYTDARHVNPLGRNTNHLILSPITRYVFAAINRGSQGEPDGMVLPGGNPIQ